jgi:hypothetical protein
MLCSITVCAGSRTDPVLQGIAFTRMLGTSGLQVSECRDRQVTATGHVAQLLSNPEQAVESDTAKWLGALEHVQ